MTYLSRGPGKQLQTPVPPPPGLASLDYTMLNAATTQALAAFRNKIMNPCGVVNQRGATGTIYNSNFSADRWHIESAGAAVGKVGLVAGTGAFSDYSNSYLFLGNSNNQIATPAAGDYAMFGQGVEGYNMADLLYGLSNAKPSTLSFKARCNGFANFKFVVSLRGAAYTRSFVKEFTCGAAGADNYFSMVIPGDTSGAWVKDKGLGVSLMFNALCGSTFATATQGQWINGNYIGTPTQSNIAANTGQNTLVISDVKWEPGTFATPLYPVPYPLELLQCMRYYQNFGGYPPPLRGVIGSSTNAARCGCALPVPMRDVPTVAIIGTVQVFNGGGTGAIQSIVGTYVTTQGIEFDLTIASIAGAAQGQAACVYWPGGSPLVNYMSFTSDM